jgi:hypothetical protein
MRSSDSQLLLMATIHVIKQTFSKLEQLLLCSKRDIPDLFEDEYQNLMNENDNNLPNSIKSEAILITFLLE